MQSILLGQLQFQKKSKRKAGDGNSSGTFRFFTSSQQQSKWLEEADFIGPALIFGTGGSASLHYCNESFSSSTDCFILKSERKDIDMKYLYYYLRTNISILENGFKGAGLKHISKEYLSEIQIPLPSLEEQKATIDKLDKLNELIELKKETISKVKILSKSIFLDMFGDPVINPKKWRFETIDKLVSKEKNALKRGPFGGALKKEIFVESGYLVYEQFHALNNDFTFARYFIDEKKFLELKGFEVLPGDILISCSGIYLGKLAIVPENSKKGIINQALLKIRLDQKIMNNDFFVYIFQDENFKQKFFGNLIGCAIPNFPPMSSFKKFLFILPDIELQNRFSDLLQLNNLTINNQNQSLQKLQELYNTTTQELFSF